jgi:ferredoxin
MPRPPCTIIIGIIALWSCMIVLAHGFEAVFVRPRSSSSSPSMFFARQQPMRTTRPGRFVVLWAEPNDGKEEEPWRPDADRESYLWRSMDEQKPPDDWEEKLRRRADGSFWKDFEPDNKDDLLSTQKTAISDDETEAEAWLDAIQSLTADEVNFNIKEADRADKMRQMVGWGFDKTTIEYTLGVAMDNSTEVKDELEGMQAYREASYWETVDLEKVESHTTVDLDEDTGIPVRSQMVYVDEHTCIGCTNCAMIAQSTFFMHSEHGRARVFQQWGDDDETIQIAIETCPVDCIHYIPYPELVDLEKDRRGQNINFKGRLVSQGENGNSMSHLIGGGMFTAPQKISGNQSARCNNCPSRGCKSCPMYGVGDNPAFKEREAARVAKRAKKQLLAQRELEEKSVEL